MIKNLRDELKWELERESKKFLIKDMKKNDKINSQFKKIKIYRARQDNKKDNINGFKEYKEQAILTILITGSIQV